MILFPATKKEQPATTNRYSNQQIQQTQPFKQLKIQQPLPYNMDTFKKIVINGKPAYRKIKREELVMTEHELIIIPAPVQEKKTKTTKKKSATKEKKQIEYKIEEYEGWETFRACYIPGYTKDKNGKNCPVHKTWEEAVEKYTEMMEEGLKCGGITQTSRGFQCRKGENPIQSVEGYAGGLACFTKISDGIKIIKERKKAEKKEEEQEFLPESDAEETQEVPPTPSLPDSDTEEESDEELDVECLFDPEGKEWYYEEEKEELYDPETHNLIIKKYKVDLENKTIEFE